jgi:hypothetical protein
MRVVLDAGALVALERSHHKVTVIMERERRAGRRPLTHGGVVGQVWRGGSGRQANLARWFPWVEVVPLDDDLGRRAGLLLGRTRTSDVVDAAVVLLGQHGDQILTSDPGDLRPLAAAMGLGLEVVPV